jgi:hypothetical protein
MLDSVHAAANTARTSGRCAVPIEARSGSGTAGIWAYGLANQIGSIEYARPRRFREKLDAWLDSIRVLWPECPAKISNDGTSLEVNRASAVLVEQRPCG